jgi:DNA-binding transcriptional LysR family regulator
MAASSFDPAQPLALPEPSWDDLRIFLAVVAHGSLNGAARALRLSQPTVARRMRALETALGVALLLRGVNQVTLTEAGRAVLEAASPMAEAAASVPRAATAYRPDPQAPVRITATASVTMFLSSHAAALAASAVPAQVAFLPTRRRLDLPAGEADIALRMRKLPDAPDLVGRRVGRIAFAMYRHRDDASDAVIVPPEDPDLSRQAAFVAKFAQERKIAARIGDMPIRYQAARAKLGAAFLPCWLGDADPELRRVTQVPDDLAEDVFLVMHARARKRREVAKVAEALGKLFKREAKRLAGTA